MTHVVLCCASLIHWNSSQKSTTFNSIQSNSFCCAFANIFASCFIFLFAVAPRCKPGTEQMSVGALNMHSMHVKCEVEADPAEVVKFHWTYNNTRNVSPVSFKIVVVY